MMGHYPISCSVRKCSVCGKSCRNSCEKCKRSLRVKTYFQIFHVTIRWHCYHKMYYIHYLKMFCNYCRINKQRILSIRVEMCFLLVNLKLYREIYPNYSLVFKRKKKNESLNSTVYKSRACQKFKFHIK